MMNPSCDSCGMEDSEHCLCSECMDESAEADRAAERKAIVAWLRSVHADRECSAGRRAWAGDFADEIERCQHASTPSPSEGSK